MITGVTAPSDDVIFTRHDKAFPFDGKMNSVPGVTSYQFVPLLVISYVTAVPTGTVAVGVNVAFSMKASDDKGFETATPFTLTYPGMIRAVYDFILPTSD